MPSQATKKSSASTTSILSEINRILRISDSYQAPERVLQVITAEDTTERARIYRELAALYGDDYQQDWFFEYFQEEHADRHQNKQDFTPPCIAGIIHHVLHDGRHTAETADGRRITYDPAAGTGQLLIRDWWLTRRQYMPWEYKPNDHLVVASELSVKTVPFLLLNLSVRGISGMVLHMNTMTQEVYDTYVLCNSENSPYTYSDILRLPHYDEQPQADEQVRRILSRVLINLTRKPTDKLERKKE